MFYPREGGGGFVAGPRDVLGIVHDERAGRYHVYAWYESPLPGPRDESQSFIRLKSWIHHTEGADSFERAVRQLDEMRRKITIADVNVLKLPEQMMQRDITSEGFADIRVVAKWDSEGNSRAL